MNRKEFEVYLDKFNARDYDGFLGYHADSFEMIHFGGSLKGREEVMKFHDFLHHYLNETVIADHFVSDDKKNPLEAQVGL
jgi:hypothetical protein